MHHGHGCFQIVFHFPGKVKGQLVRGRIQTFKCLEKETKISTVMVGEYRWQLHCPLASRDTGLHAFSDTIGMREKCHCK